jgi:hypothetical protein
MDENIPFGLFWHLTSFDNIENILRMGLLSRNKLIELNQKYSDKARPDLIEERNEKDLVKYVPFHFMPLSPYAKEIFRKNRDVDFCYITIRDKIASDESKYKILLEYSNHLKKIELKNYNDCKNKIEEIRKNTDFVYGKTSGKDKRGGPMGECLALDCVKPEKFYAIVVKSKDTEMELKNILGKLDKKIECRIICKQGCFR